MPKSTRSKIAKQARELALLAPIVAGARLTRLARQRPHTAAKNLQSMGNEKMTTFGQAWMAMASTGWMHSMSAWSSICLPPSTRKSAAPAEDAALAVLESGLRPLHARVKKNIAQLKKR